MGKTEDAHWHCVNRDCGWSAVMAHASCDDTVPRCVCGEPMKRSAMAPVFSYLDFLRDEDSLAITQKANEE